MTNIFTRFYVGIIKAGEAVQSYLLLAMRLYWGYQFFQTGMGKLANIDKIAAYFQSLNIPFPEANAHIVASLETVGGLLLIFGLASRLISIPLILIMLTAYATAHHDSLTDPEAFISQAPFHFLLTCLLVFAFGPGKFSIDGLLKRFIGN